MDVIKRNGKKQNFSSSKLCKSIENVLKEAKVSQRGIVLAELCESLKVGLKGKRSIKAIELRRMVLSRLERRSKKAVALWRKFEAKK